ncbi:MAG: DUF2188 domain-containing protein [Gemmatimonadota bacterium]
MDRKKVIGAAAGAAAAATAVGIAAAAMKGRKPTVYHVRPREDGWVVVNEKAHEPASSHPNKRQAVKAGREMAGNTAPSRLVIHRADDTVQKEHSYEPPG